MPEEIRFRIAALREDHSNGAVAVTAEAARILIELAEQSGVSQSDIEHAALELVAAQPTMAPVFNLADQVLWRSGEPSAVAALCRDFVRNQRESAAWVAQEANKLIPPGGVVMTHSHSGTVRGALLEAQAAGKNIRVVVTESRPLCEGRALARALGQADIPVTLIVDAAMARFVTQVDLVLVGADAVSPRGVLNKIGTNLLAMAAQSGGKPFYTLCDSSKILRGEVKLAEEAPKDPNEVLPDELPETTVANYYFDWTPLRLLTGVVFEGGVCTPDELRDSVREVVLHPVLARN